MDLIQILAKRKVMKIEITLNDDNEQPVIIISNCHQDKLVNVEILDESCSVEVSIEELKNALRKITA